MNLSKRLRNSIVRVLLVFLIILSVSFIKNANANTTIWDPFKIVWLHKGGYQISHDRLEYTVDFVIDSLPNLSKDVNLKRLVLETLIVETLVGKSSYDFASKNYRNYGIAQIRVETAQDVLNWLKKTDLKTYDAIMNLKNGKSLKENLLHNVPFSIAICGEYYIRRNVDLKKLNKLENRAYYWKKVYNTPKGLGTEKIYCNRVEKYYTEIII